MGFDTLRRYHCIYQIFKKIKDEVHKDLSKVSIKWECLKLDCLIDFVY